MHLGVSVYEKTKKYNFNSGKKNQGLIGQRHKEKGPFTEETPLTWDKEELAQRREHMG